jgi:hypothetical protein
MNLSDPVCDPVGERAFPVPQRLRRFAIGLLSMLMGG